MFRIALSAGVGGGTILRGMAGGQTVGAASLVLDELEALVYVVAEKDGTLEQFVLLLAQNALHRVGLSLAEGALLRLEACGCAPSFLGPVVDIAFQWFDESLYVRHGGNRIGCSVELGPLIHEVVIQLIDNQGCCNLSGFRAPQLLHGS